MNRLIKEINNTDVKSGSLNIWWLGQEGYVIKSPDLVIYIDPYLSTYAERITLGKPNEHVRMMKSPILPEDVTNADLVLCTHDHADHIDPEAGYSSGNTGNGIEQSTLPSTRSIGFNLKVGF